MKKVITIFLACIFILIAFLFFLPSMASTSWGNAQLLKLISSRSSNTVDAKQIHLSWLGPQSVQGLSIIDSQGNTRFSIDNASIDSSIFQLFWNRQLQGDLKINSLQATISQEPLIRLRDVNAALTFNSDDQLFNLSFNGTTHQGPVSGKFDLNLQFDGLNIQRLISFKENPLKLFEQNPKAQLKIKADTSNMPVDLMDQLLAYVKPEFKGLLTSALGQNLSFSINQSMQQDLINLDLQARSTQLEARLKANLTPNSISLEEPGKIWFQINPEFATRLAALVPDLAKWRLEKPALAEVSLDQFLLPIKNSDKAAHALNYDASSFKAQIKVAQANVEESETKEKLTFDHTLLTVEKLSDHEVIQTSLMSELIHRGQTMPLRIPKMEWLVDENVTLVHPVNIQTNLTAQFVNRIFLANQPAKLENDLEVNILLRQLSFPLCSFDPRLINIQADITFSPLLLGQIPSIGEAKINGLGLALRKNPLEKSLFHAKAAISQPGDSGIVAYSLGAQTNVTARLEGDFNTENRFVFNLLNVQLTSPLAQMHLEGKFGPNNQLFLTQPAILNYTLTQAALNSLGIKPASVHLTKDTPIKIAFESPAKGINFSNLQDLNLAGKILIDELYLSSTSHQATASLQELLFSWEIDGPKNAAYAKFDGNTLLNGAAGHLNGTFFVRNWIKDPRTTAFRKAAFQVQTNLSNVPTALFAPFSAPLDLSAVIGNSISLLANVNLNLAESKEGIVQLKVESENMDGKAFLNISRSITLNETNEPASIHLTLTPRGYAAIRDYFQKNTSQDLVLNDPASISLTLKSLSLPLNLKAEQPFIFWKGAFTSDLTINRLNAISPATGKRVSLDGIHAHITSNHLGEKVLFQINAQNFVGISGIIENGLNEQGSLNSETLSLDASIKMDALPAHMLCQLACLHPCMGRKIQALFGDVIHGNIQMKLRQMNGPLFAEVTGKNGRLFVDGNLASNHLTLNKALEMNVEVTPELSQYVLQEYFPFLSGMVSADQPLKIRFNPEGFSLPLFPLHTFATQVQRASIDLGHVQFSNTGQLATVISLFVPEKKETISVWLTPIYFSMNEGTLKLERVDMLIGKKYPLAAWGKVHLFKDKVNMVIALSGYAISQAFNVPIQDKNYLLQLPLKGTMSNATIDKSKATTRISALVAQSQGNPQGFVIGTFLDIASGNFAEDKPPASTTNPVPWKDLLEEKSAIPKATTPIQEIEKGFNSLLKKVLISLNGNS